jgi:[ribosomal protein S18]-alanine N-acetyltransferase
MTMRQYDAALDRALVRSWIDGRDTFRWLAGDDGDGTDADPESWRTLPGTSRWIMEREGCPVAYGEIEEHAAEHYAQIARILVDPAKRGKGAGREMVRLLGEAARAQHPMWPVYARLDADNLAALLAYPAAGLAPLEPLPPDFDDRSVWLILLDDEPTDRGGRLD